MSINIELLRKVQQAIRAEPKQFYMHDFFTTYLRDETIPNCGTAACIAGWVVAIDRRLNPQDAKQYINSDACPGPTWIEAMKALNITKQQEELLFYTDNWPDEFDFAYDDAIDDKNFTEAAEVACRRIDHFISTNGEE